MLKIDPKLQKYFKGFCYSPYIIMVCLYMKFRFSLSYRDIEELSQLRGLNHRSFNFTKVGNKICFSFRR